MDRFFVFDTEDNSKGKLYWINFYDGDYHYSFNSKEKAINFLYKLREQKIIIFAVNLEYDLNNLFGENIQDLKIVYGTKVLWADYYKIKFYDTLNHWQNVSVEKMGNFLNYKKLPFEPANLEYCKRDCEVTYKFVFKMLKVYLDLGLENIYPTIAGTSYALWNDKFRNFKIYRIKKDVLTYFKKFYFGGRCECFYLGKYQKVVYVDVNSLYPSVMLNEFPYPFNYSIDKKIKGKFYLIQAIVESNMDIPILPVKLNNSLIFPNGIFSGYFNSVEFEKFIELGGKCKRVIKVINFSDTHKPFELFVNKLYPLKKNAKDVFMKQVVKYLLNSLYGKFAQYKELNECSSLDAWKKKKNKRSVEVRNNIVIDRKQSFSYHTNFIYSVFVSAYSRLVLYNEIYNLKDKSKVLYCDTDSVMYQLNKKVYHTKSDKLGIFSVVDIYDYVYIKGLKFYETFINNKRKFTIKGIKKDSRKDYFDKGKCIINRPVKFRESKRIKTLNGKINYWLDFEKIDRRLYKKGLKLKTGQIIPLTLNYVDGKNQLKEEIKRNGKKRDKKRDESKISKIIRQTRLDFTTA